MPLFLTCFFAYLALRLTFLHETILQFPNLVMKIAGDTNAGFLDIDSNLGTGFYILIAYSVVAGFLQFSLRIRHNYKSSQSALQGTDGEKATEDV